jgi:hypothetical protein
VRVWERRERIERIESKLASGHTDGHSPLGDGWRKETTQCACVCVRVCVFACTEKSVGRGHWKTKCKGGAADRYTATDGSVLSIAGRVPRASMWTGSTEKWRSYW